MLWWKIVGIVVGVLVVLFVLYILFQESSRKHYQKARRLHKKGEHAYLSKDFDAAEKYYKRAEDARKRARELE